MPPPDRQRIPTPPRRRRPREMGSQHRGAVPLLPLLALDAEPGVGDGPEAGTVDRLPAADADAVGAVPEPLQGFLDHLEQALYVALDGELLLPLEGLGGDVDQVIVVSRHVRHGLLLGLELMLFHLGKLLDQALALLEQQPGELVLARAALPSRSRRGTDAGPSPIRGGQRTFARAPRPWALRPSARWRGLSGSSRWHLWPPCGFG